MKSHRIIASYFFQKTCYHGNHIMHSVALPKSKVIVLLREQAGEIFSNSYVNNYYWMRLSMISWIIKTEVCVIWQSRRLRQITQTWGFDNSWYHAKTGFNNCFIIHLSHNSSSETEAKHSAILFLRRTLQGA